MGHPPHQRISPRTQCAKGRAHLQRVRAHPRNLSALRLIAAGGIENTIGWDITYVGDDGWIGFDTAHAWDVWDFDPLYKATPGVKPDTGMFTPRYWNVGKVVEEAKGLCDRIREAETTLQAQR